MHNPKKTTSNKEKGKREEKEPIRKTSLPEIFKQKKSLKELLTLNINKTINKTNNIDKEIIYFRYFFFFFCIMSP